MLWPPNVLYNVHQRGCRRCATSSRSSQRDEFRLKYPKANPDDDALRRLRIKPAAQYTEFRMQGTHVWRACFVQNGRPVVFFDDDTGWNTVQATIEFEQIY